MAPPDEPPQTPPPADPDEAAEARRRGMTVVEYRAVRIFEQAAARDDRPADIAREEDKAAAMRRAPGIFKGRNESPNLLAQAMETPGEVARMVIFVLLYLAALIAIVVLGGEKVQKMPGVFQCVLLGLLVIPVMWLTGRVWEAVGERGRDVARFFVRAWPLTLVLLLLLLGGLRLLFGGRH